MTIQEFCFPTKKETISEKTKNQQVKQNFEHWALFVIALRQTDYAPIYK